MERALSAGLGTAPSSTIQNSITLYGDVDMDGLKVAKIVLQNLDDAKKMM